MRDIVTVREAVARAKADGLPVSEHTLRCWLKAGEIPARKAGNKTLLYYPNLIKYLQCENSEESLA
jgi:predicted site-specific integrase-resolvase